MSIMTKWSTNNAGAGVECDPVAPPAFCLAVVVTATLLLGILCWAAGYGAHSALTSGQDSPAAWEAAAALY